MMGGLEYLEALEKLRSGVCSEFWRMQSRRSRLAQGSALQTIGP